MSGGEKSAKVIEDFKEKLKKWGSIPPHAQKVIDEEMVKIFLILTTATRQSYLEWIQC